MGQRARKPVGLQTVYQRTLGRPASCVQVLNAGMDNSNPYVYCLTDSGSTALYSANGNRWVEQQIR